MENLNIRIIGNNNSIILGKNCKILRGCDVWIIGDNNNVTIGDNTTIGPYCAIEVQEKEQFIKIGSDNMWSHHVRLRNNDSHYIYDRETGKRTNYAKSITIGNHVWIAAYATILKGVNIGGGSVIGTHALVTKEIPEHVVSAGIPAKVVQSNIEWSRLPKEENLS